MERARASSKPAAFEVWPIVAGLHFTSKDHAGLGKLELASDAGRVAHWRYTVSRAEGVRRISDRLDLLQRGVTPPAVTPAAETIECSLCGAPYDPALAACPECGNCTSDKKPIRSLFRLLAFAKNHMWMSILGFLLTLASTSAGLIPPYLTMPLLDQILIPYQNGQHEIGRAHV